MERKSRRFNARHQSDVRSCGAILSYRDRGISKSDGIVALREACRNRSRRVVPQSVDLRGDTDFHFQREITSRFSAVHDFDSAKELNQSHSFSVVTISDVKTHAPSREMSG